MAWPNDERKLVEQRRDDQCDNRRAWCTTCPTARQARTRATSRCREEELLLVVVVVGGRVVDALLELLLRLPEGTSELRELRATEQQDDDQEDEEQLGRTKVHTSKGSGSACRHTGRTVTTR